jgi:hypothetical protein
MAFRVLRPNGWLAVFDGDYAAVTVATGDHDPLHTCVEAFRGSFVQDRWLIWHLTGSSLMPDLPKPLCAATDSCRFALPTTRSASSIGAPTSSPAGLTSAQISRPPCKMGDTHQVRKRSVTTTIHR